MANLDFFNSLASSIYKMTTETLPNMLCQFKILLLTRKGHFPILIPSKSEIYQSFNNIEKKVPTKSLFVFPEDYIKSKNVIGPTTRGTRCKGINKKEGKKK